MGQIFANVDASFFTLEMEFACLSLSLLFHTFTASQASDLAGQGGGGGRQSVAMDLVEVGTLLIRLPRGSLGWL